MGAERAQRENAGCVGAQPGQQHAGNVRELQRHAACDAETRAGPGRRARCGAVPCNNVTSAAERDPWALCGLRPVAAQKAESATRAQLFNQATVYVYTSAQAPQANVTAHCALGSSAGAARGGQSMLATGTHAWCSTPDSATSGLATA